MPFTPDAPKSGFKPDPVQPNPHEVANNQEKSNPNGLMDYLKKGVGMYATHMMGAAKAATLGNLPLPGYEQMKKENPGSALTGEIQGSVGQGALTGAAASMIPASGILARLGIGAAQGAATGGLAKPEDGENRLDNAAKGGLVGGVAQGGLEAARALPGAVQSAFRSVVPQGFKAYGDSIAKAASAESPELGEVAKNFQKGPWLEMSNRTANPDYGPARDLLKEASPEISDMMAQNSSERFGQSIRDKGFKWGGGIGAILGGPVGAAKAAAAGVGAGALAGGGKEFMRQVAKPGSPAVSPEALQSLLNLISTEKSNK